MEQTYTHQKSSGERINTKADLKRWLAVEKELNLKEMHGSEFYAFITCSKYYWIWKFIKTLRTSEYHYNAGHKLRYLWYHRKKHKLERKYQFEISENNIGIGFRMFHLSGIFISESSDIGKNFIASGDLCIGGDVRYPDGRVVGATIGDNVMAGWGVTIMGDVHIADDVILGTDCLVIHDINEPGAKVCGIPAKIVGNIHDTK